MKYLLLIMIIKYMSINKLKNSSRMQVRKIETHFNYPVKSKININNFTLKTVFKYLFMFVKKLKK